MDLALRLSHTITANIEVLIQVLLLTVLKS